MTARWMFDVFTSAILLVDFVVLLWVRKRARRMLKDGDTRNGAP